MVVTDSRPIAQVASELDISATSLSTWLKAYRREWIVSPDEPSGAAASRQDRDAELQQLRREVKNLTEENLFLKKVSAYFARQTR